MNRRCGCLLAALILCWPGSGAGSGDVVYLAYPLRLFAHVDVDDAQAAVEVWIDALGRDWGLPFDVEAKVFEDPATLVDALSAGGVDLVGLFPLQYLQIRDQLAIKPVLIPTYGDEMTYRSVLLVRKDRQIETWRDLAGEDLIAAHAARGDAGRLWMEVELLRRGLGESQAFFGQVREVDRTAQAVLPVFLGQTAACLVPQEQFAVMVELNPQLGQQLVALGTSPEVCYGVVCQRPGFDPERWSLLKDRLTSMHELPLGQQIFKVFHYGKLAPFDPSYMEDLIDLVAEYEALKAQQGAVADE